MSRMVSVFLTFFLGVVSFAQQDSSRLKLLFVGDVMQHGGQIAGAYYEKKDRYHYTDCFQFIEPVVKRADIAIANLEVTHAGKPYKGYPQFSAPPELSGALVEAGFNVIITANNHSCDGGGSGVVKTLDVLDRLRVKHTGTFRSKQERDQNYPLLIEKNGFRVAVLNYTYGTNGLSVAAPLIINYIDSAVMEADFKKARQMKVDLIVCTLHWGTEYQSLPNDYQKNWEKFCYDQGADMVIGGHPHVLQPVEVKEIGGEKKLTAWSLGNFVSNQRDRTKDGGMILMAEVKKEAGKTTLGQVEHAFTWVYPRQEALNKPFYILPDFDYNHDRPGFLDAEAKSKYDLFFSDSKALFQEHSRGTTEYVVSDPLIIDRFRKLLTGYYAFEYAGLDYERWKGTLSLADQSVFHQVLGVDGNYHQVFGYYSTAEELKNKIVIEAEIAEPNIVFISPTAYKVIK